MWSHSNIHDSCSSYCDVTVLSMCGFVQQCITAPLYVLQDAADALHLLTVQRQLHERVSGIPSLGGGTQRYSAPTPAPLSNPRGGAVSGTLPHATGDGGHQEAVAGPRGAADDDDDALFSSLKARGREMQQQYKRRPARVHLLGRQAPLDFGTFSSSSRCGFIFSVWARQSLGL